MHRAVRPVEATDGLQFAALVEAASRRNGSLQRKNPEIDVGELPDIGIVWAGGQPEPGAPFRLSVPDLGMVVVDPERMLLATEGDAARDAVEVRPELQLRAALHATRVVGKAPWAFGDPLPDRPLGKREKEFARWLVKRAIEQLINERSEGGD